MVTWVTRAADVYGRAFTQRGKQVPRWYVGRTLLSAAFDLILTQESQCQRRRTRVSAPQVQDQRGFPLMRLLVF